MSNDVDGAGPVEASVSDADLQQLRNDGLEFVADEIERLRDTVAALTAKMENAGMDEARRQFGFGVTRTAVRKIFTAMINAR